MVTINDLLSVLPKYYDDSGYDVVVTVANSWQNANRKMYRTFESLTTDELQRPIVLIEGNKALVNGEATEQMHIIIQESEDTTCVE